jgi:Ion transport protein
MRPYKTTGPLVAMIFEVVGAMGPFMTVFAIVVLGFANSFYGLLRENRAGSYSGVWFALRSSFLYMFGGYDIDELDAVVVQAVQVVLSILLVIFIIIVSILLLNLLIAIINTKFSELYTTRESHWRHEQAKIILARHSRLFSSQQEKLKDYFMEKRYLHVLKPQSQ